MTKVETPTATAGLIAEQQRLGRDLVGARRSHKDAETRASRANAASYRLYHEAVEIEHALDAVEAAMVSLGTQPADRPEGAETIRGKYAHNYPVDA